MSVRFSERSTQELTETGFAALETQNFAEALWIARELKRRVLRADSRMAAALDVLRKSRNRLSRQSKVWRIMLSGMGDVDERELGFFINYDVLADDAAEAFRYAREIERLAGHRRLRLEESRVLREEPGAPKGVLELCGGYAFFDEREE